MSAARLFSLACIACAVAAFYPRHPGELSAAQLAAAAQDQLPMPVGNGAKLVAIRAEGDTLAFHIDGPPGWLRGLSRDGVAAAMRASLCRTDTFRLILNSDKSVRADVSSGGDPPVPGAVIEDCKGGSGGGT